MPASSPQSPTQPTHLAALDGLRLVCCSWVVWGHAYVGHPAQDFMSRLSGAGVDVFFALSGFLITRILLNERARRGRINLFNFYVRRTLRIWPVYYLAIAIAVTGIVVLGDRFTRPLGVSAAAIDVWAVLWRHALFVANLFHTTVPTALDVLWSICVEEQFYLAFPVLWARSTRAAPVFPVAAVLLVAAWACRIFLAQSDPGQIYRNPLAHADHLLVGALVAQVAQVDAGRLQTFARRLGRWADVATVGLLLAIVAWNTKAGDSAVEWWAHYLLSALVCGLLVALLAFGQGRLRQLLSLRWMAALGTLTYAGYVFHIYALAVAWFVAARVVPESSAQVPLRAVLATVGTFLIAWVSKRLLEDRVLSLKARFASSPSPSVETQERE